MKIEINKEQIANISEKMSLCVTFLKTEVQPHLTKNDKIIVSAGYINDSDELELQITSKTLSIVQIGSYSIGPDNWSLDVPRKRTYTLTKNPKKRNKKDKSFICEAYPEAAIEFLKHWDSVKTKLQEEVAAKNKEVDKINNFIDGFRL